MKKEKGSSSMVYNIPNHIIFDIFLQLPIKTVLRCKSVCKLWHAIIEDPCFAFMHWKKIKNTPAQIFLLESGIVSTSYNFWPLLEQDVNIDTGSSTTSKKPKSLFSSRLDVVGSCNGLICLKVVEQAKFQIMSPLYSIADAYEVEFPPRRTLTDVVGFGYKFKIVCLERKFPHGVNIAVHELGGSTTPSWKRLSQQFIEYSYIDIYPTKSSVFADGCIHWLAALQKGDEIRKSVVSFNFATETLELKPLPVADFGLVLSYRDDKSVDLDGSLCVVTRSISNIRVWVFCGDNNKKITKKWIVKFSNPCPWNRSGVVLVGFFKAYHILIKDLGRYYSFNVQTRITTHLPELASNKGLLLCHQPTLIRPSNLLHLSI